MKIVEYKIVTGQGNESLVKNVNEAIQKGFQPWGDPFEQTPLTQQIRSFAQAMVKYSGQSPTVD